MATPELNFELALKAALRRVAVLTEENIILESMIEGLTTETAEKGDTIPVSPPAQGVGSPL